MPGINFVQQEIIRNYDHNAKKSEDRRPVLARY